MAAATRRQFLLIPVLYDTLVGWMRSGAGNWCDVAGGSGGTYCNHCTIHAADPNKILVSDVVLFQWHRALAVSNSPT